MASTNKTEEKVTSHKVVKHQDPLAYQVLQAPLITEKATDLMAQNKYCFRVPVTATKSEVIKKIKNIYGVSPVKVNIVRMGGSLVRRGKVSGMTNRFKKAIVTLKQNDKIEIYAGV